MAGRFHHLPVTVASALIAVGVALSLVAAPVLAATTAFTVRAQGSALGAFYSNIVWDQNGFIPPGDYFVLYLDAAKSLSLGGDPFESNYAAVYYESFTVDSYGNFLPGEPFYTSFPVTSLKVLSLNTGRFVGSGTVQKCVAWNEWGYECIEWVSRQLAVDVTVSGVGDATRWHGTQAWGTAGYYQTASQGVGAWRASVPTGGTVTLDGRSLLAGASSTGGYLYQAKSGLIEVTHWSPAP